jgi:hypothetical protein
MMMRFPFLRQVLSPYYNPASAPVLLPAIQRYCFEEDKRGRPPHEGAVAGSSLVVTYRSLFVHILLFCYQLNNVWGGQI